MEPTITSYPVFILTISRMFVGSCVNSEFSAPFDCDGIKEANSFRFGNENLNKWLFQQNSSS